MRARSSFLIWVAMIWGLAATAAGAHEPAGLRALAMGGAFTAVADDVSAVYWNPAGLVYTAFGLQGGFSLDGSIEEAELLTAFLDGLSSAEGSAEAAINGSIALTFGRLGAAVLIEESWADIHFEVDQDDIPSGTGQAGLIGSVVVGAAGRFAHVSAGAAVRLLSGVEKGVRYSPGPAPFPYVEEVDEWKGDGRALDVGVLVELPMVALGAAARNLTGSISWTGSRTVRTHDAGGEVKPQTEALNGYTDPLERSFRFGAAAQVPIAGILAAADYDTRGSLHLGAERHFLFNTISLRAGQIFYLKDDRPNVATAGFGLNLGPFHATLAVATTDWFETFERFGVETGFYF